MTDPTPAPDPAGWTPPDPETVLAQLVGFQRDAVEHAFHRLYEAPDGTQRFLVADEVGLGKTLIARGLLAKATDHLARQGVRRIDIIYICSNQQIARQNLRRLNLFSSIQIENAERITLLPLTLSSLERQRVNLVAFTPSTSLEMKSRLGTWQERLLLHHLLEAKWHVGGTGPANLLQGGITDDAWFRERAKHFGTENDVSVELTKAFHAALDGHVTASITKGEPDLQTRYRELCLAFRVRRDK